MKEWAINVAFNFFSQGENRDEAIANAMKIMGKLPATGFTLKIDAKEQGKDNDQPD